MVLKFIKSILSCISIILILASTHLIAQNPADDELEIDKEPVYTNLSKALRNAEKVYKLNLSNKKLNEFPIDILKLKQLRLLILDSNTISFIPQQISELQNLRYLSIAHNSIAEIPISIGDLNKLRFLYIDYNNISTLPSSFFKLNQLEDLFINNNSIKELPKEIQVLQKLERLIASHNQFESIPDEIGHLFGLKKLSFAHNKIKTLPEHFYELTNLTVLYLHNNSIHRIDSKIKKINKLEGLTLDFNKLTDLPIELGELYNLKTLYINNNELIELPSELGNLFKLQNLFIGNNPIKQIPVNFNNLTKLQIFDISNILIQPFPQALYDIQNNGTKIQGLTTKELYQAKILLSQARNKKLTDHANEAIALYDKLIKIDTNNIVVMTEYASILLEVGEFDKAALISKLALSKNMSQKNIDDLRVIYSNSINRASKTELTISNLNAKIKKDSTNASPIFDLGKLYFDQQKYEDAKSTLYQAIKVDPTYANSHFYLAVIALTLKNDSLFIMAALRYFLLQPEGLKTSSTYPFLLSKMKMKLGVTGKNGNTAYYDSFIIKDDNKEVIYKSENPSSELLSAMIFDLTRDDLFKKKDKKINSDLQEIIEETLYSKKNNFEIFQLEFTKICKALNNEVKEQDKKLWDYYLPYYSSLINNGHLEAFAYLVTKIRANSEENSKWLNNHADQLEKFRQWDKAYNWGNK